MTVINLSEGQEKQQAGRCVLQVKGSGWGAKELKRGHPGGKLKSLSKEAEVVGLDTLPLKETSNGEASDEAGTVNMGAGVRCCASGEGERWALTETPRNLTEGQTRGGKICCLLAKSLLGNPLCWSHCTPLQPEPAGLGRCGSLVYSAIPEVRVTQARNF